MMAGSLLIVAILLPAAGALLAFALGGRFAERMTLGLSPLGLALAIAIATTFARADKPVAYMIGGLEPPLGISLRTDGLSATMLVAVAIIMITAMLYARAKFGLVWARMKAEARSRSGS